MIPSFDVDLVQVLIDSFFVIAKLFDGTTNILVTRKLSGLKTVAYLFQ